MFQSLIKVLALLHARQRRGAIKLFVLILSAGFMEAAGVASIMPFIAVISDPTVIERNALLEEIHQWLGRVDTGVFLQILGGAVCLVVLANLAMKLWAQHEIHRFAQRCNYTLASTLFRLYLQRPYAFFLDRHSADLGKAVLAEVNHVVSGALLPVLQLAAGAILALCLIGLVILKEPVIGLGALTFFAAAYVGVYGLSRRHLRDLGVARHKAVREKFRVAQETLAGIKDVKVLRLEEASLRSFQEPAARYAEVNVKKQVASQVPSVVMQGLTFVGLMAILQFLLLARASDIASVLPTIVLLALAGSRIQGALHQVYQALASLRYAKAGLDTLHADMTDVPQQAAAVPSRRAGAERLPLESSLVLDDISFTYPNAERTTLVDVNISIPARKTVALVGATGSGKTTVMDLILGLLSPQQGRIRIDGRPLAAEDLPAWQANIGYVSQHIFLRDDSVAANIAFGVPAERIDMDAVERAARVAQLHDFVVRELPQGYGTMVGDRGVRLSGGQRQRIGIARALYHDPGVLVLDEATSALDTVTEQQVMSAVRSLGGSKTIIIVAHRLSTVRSCDLIFYMDQGSVTARGTFDQLISESDGFRMAAGAAF